MKINVYLPDEIGDKAKGAELNLSGLLREAVEHELGRRERVSKMLEGASEHELALRTEDGKSYTGVLAGVKLGENHEEGPREILYLATDRRVMSYRPDNGEVDQLIAVSSADEWDDPNTYIAVCEALGEPARVAV